MGRTYWQSASQTATRTKVAQGTDGSPLYVKNNAGNFILAHANSGTVVSLKAFLSQYSMKIEYGIEEDEDSKKATTSTFTVNSGPKITYSIGLQLIAHSLTEAKLNLARINEINKMFHSTFPRPTTPNTNISLAYDPFIVQYSNLISAKYQKKINYFDKQTLLTQGIPGFIESFKFEVDKEIGMFEENDKLYPKLINFSFDLHLSQKLFRTNYLHTYKQLQGFLYMPFKTNGNLWNYTGINFTERTPQFYAAPGLADDGIFPFGVKTGAAPLSKFPPSGMGRDGSVDYSSNNNAYIFICSDKVEKRFVSFKPFLESFSFDLSYQQKVSEIIESMGSVAMEPNRAEEISKVSKWNLSFNCVAHSIEEARQNMIKVQVLMRLLINYRPVVTSGDPDDAIPTVEGDLGNYKSVLGYKFPNSVTSSTMKTWIKFSNLIANKDGYVQNRDDIVEFGRKFIVSSMEIDVDEQVGLFEHEGLFYFKVIKISLGLDESLENEKPYDMESVQTSQKPHLWNTSNELLPKNSDFKEDIFIGDDFDNFILKYDKGTLGD